MAFHAEHYRQHPKFTSGIIWDHRQHPQFMTETPWDHREPPPPWLNAQALNVHVAHLNAVQPESGRVSDPLLLPRLAWHEPEKKRIVLPPLSIHIESSIIRETASIVVTQRFFNDSDTDIKEAGYTFPLPTGCTVTDFHCRIGNKHIKSTIKPKDEAREKFRHHVQQHDTSAALLEQDTPEIFTCTLGNLHSNTEITVTLTYITLLKHRFADSKGTSTLTIPTYIASRYGRKPEGYNDAATSDVCEGLTIRAVVNSIHQDTAISSPTHNVAVEKRQRTRNAASFSILASTNSDAKSHAEMAVVEFASGPAELDRDFVLDISTKHNSENEPAQALLETHPALPGHKALMVTIPSTFMSKPSKPHNRGEILFLADLSGSMGDKTTSLKSAMQFFLKGIPEGRIFNIWCFGSSYKSWQPRSVEYSQATLDSAQAWVTANFDSDMGGTELLPALKAMINARDKTLLTDIIVLTDGEVWQLDQTLDHVQQTRTKSEGRVRFFALGIGRSVSHALVNGIAKAGGGYADVVREASEGGWEDIVVSMTKAALMTDHLGPLRFRFNVRGADGQVYETSLAEAQRSPADISALSPSPYDRNRVYLLWDAATSDAVVESVTIQTSVGEETKSFSIPVTVLREPNSTVHKLAARSLLHDLERGQSHIHLGPARPYPGSWEETNAVTKEAEKIACKWSLISKWTSFLLIQEDDPLPPKTNITEASQPNDPLDDELLQPVGNMPEALVANLVNLVDNESRWPRGYGLSGFPANHSYTPESRTVGGACSSPIRRCSSIRTNNGGKTMNHYHRDFPPPFPPIPTTTWGISRSHEDAESDCEDSVVLSSKFPAYRVSDMPNSPDFGDDDMLVLSNFEPRSIFSLDETSISQTTTKAGEKRGFVREALGFQTAEGSFKFADGFLGAEKLLGKEITTKLIEITKVVKSVSESDLHRRPRVSEAGLITVAILVLLRRDFAPSKSLWGLMAVKAEAYLSSSLDEEDKQWALAQVSSKLDGVSVPQEYRASVVDEKKHTSPKTEIIVSDDKDRSQQTDEENTGGGTELANNRDGVNIKVQAEC